jgi:ribosomal-protein-alanine N-acetyltransferase
MEITTPRLKLRHARPGDLYAMHAVLSDPRATRWWSTLPHTSIEDTRVWLEGMIAGNAQGADDFVLERDGQVIGKVGFFKLPEVGYILHPDHWGLGLGSEAVAAAVGHVFHTRAIDDLTADVDPANHASTRLLERLGFERTGYAERTWNIGGEWKDSLYYGLTRRAWTRHANGSSSSP